MKREDLNESRLWAMEYVLEFYNPKQGALPIPIAVTQEVLSKFNDEDQETLQFLKEKNCLMVMEVFGLIELMSIYTEEGYSIEEMCKKTSIPKSACKYAQLFMDKYKKYKEDRDNNEPEDPIIDKLKSIMSGNGLEQKNGSRATNKKGSKTQPFTTSPEPATL